VAVSPPPPPPPPLTDNKRETQQGVRGNPKPTVQFVTSGKGRRDIERGKEEGRYRDRVRQGGCEWKRQEDIDGQEERVEIGGGRRGKGDGTAVGGRSGRNGGIRVGNFRPKNNSAEDGIDGTNGYFRRNSGCSAEEKISEFRIRGRYW
jgi:hypothetical protein